VGPPVMRSCTAMQAIDLPVHRSAQPTLGAGAADGGGRDPRVPGDDRRGNGADTDSRCACWPVSAVELSVRQYGRQRMAANGPLPCSSSISTASNPSCTSHSLQQPGFPTTSCLAARRVPDLLQSPVALHYNDHAGARPPPVRPAVPSPSRFAPCPELPVQMGKSRALPNAQAGPASPSRPPEGLICAVCPSAAPSLVRRRRQDPSRPVAGC